MIRVYPITPVPAPRQTRADAFKKGREMRPEVARYRAFRDEVAVRKVQIPQTFHHIVFVLAVPDSWATSKRIIQEGMPHTSKPDRDNLEKALLDSVLGEDAHVWDGRVTKLWGRRGMVIVSSVPLVIMPPVDLRGCYRALEANVGRTHGIIDGVGPEWI